MENEKEVAAGLWVRCLAFAFDYVLIAGYLVLLVGSGFTLSRLWPTAAKVLFGGPIAGEASGFVTITLPVGLYFALSEASSRQATWGKRRVGLRVTDGAGRRLGFLRSAGRTALKFVPWELAHACIWQISFAGDPSAPVYTIGFATVWLLVAANVISLLVSPRRRTLYDRLAGTVVVRAATPRG